MKYIMLLALFITSNAFSMKVTAHSWLVANGDGKIIEGESIDHIRSIASITKLMTAMVIIDAGQDPQQRLGKFTREQHIQLALVKSSNESAIILCDNYPGGKPNCIKDMNLKAKAINMPNTKFVEASGLSPMNISTARDLLELTLSARYYPDIVEASKTSQVKIQIKKRWFFFNNTNPIIGKRHNFIVSKTGTTNAAGGCIVMMLDTDIGRRIVVVLGSKNGKTRIPEAEFIALQEYRSENYGEPKPYALAH